MNEPQQIIQQMKARYPGDWTSDNTLYPETMDPDDLRTLLSAYMGVPTVQRMGEATYIYRWHFPPVEEWPGITVFASHPRHVTPEMARSMRRLDQGRWGQLWRQVPHGRHSRISWRKRLSRLGRQQQHFRYRRKNLRQAA